MPTNVDLELQERLGSGRTSEVWRAFDPQSQCYVAVKIFHSELVNDPAFMTRFWNVALSPEAQKLHSLHHPTIVQIHGFQISRHVETESPVAYIVMDYIEGPTLADYLRNTS